MPPAICMGFVLGVTEAHGRSQEYILGRRNRGSTTPDPLNATRAGLHIMRLRYEDFLNPSTLSLVEQTKYDASWSMF